MTAVIVSLRVGALDPLAELHAGRDGLGQELQRLGIIDTRLADAEGRLGEVDKALAAIDSADRQAVEQWATTGGEGDAPQPLLSERRTLLASRLDVQAEVDAARIAVDAVAAKRTGLIAQMNAIGLRIREQQLAAVLDEARQLHSEAEAIAADLGLRIQRVMGLRSALVDAMNDASNQRNPDLAQLYGGALSAFDALKRPEIFADLATVSRYASEWKGKLR